MSTQGITKMRNAMIRTILPGALAVLFLACSKGHDQAPQFSAAGEHPSGWLQSHWAEFAKQPSQCTTCHGSLSDPTKAGGTSQVSCFTCHAKGVYHPGGWASGSMHGRDAANLAPSKNTGFAYCFKCHGATAGTGLTATTCAACHTKAPHPGRPWASRDLSKPNHDAVAQGNATVCFTCHAEGRNSTVKPKEPAPPGTPAGCFNNSMCHSKSL